MSYLSRTRLQLIKAGVFYPLLHLLSATNHIWNKKTTTYIYHKKADVCTLKSAENLRWPALRRCLPPAGESAVDLSLVQEDRVFQ